MKPPIAITMGDPAGVGPELSFFALRDQRVNQICCPVVFGDLPVLRRVASRLSDNWDSQSVHCVAVEDWHRVTSSELVGPTVVDFSAQRTGDIHCGQVDAVTGRASHDYIVAAIRATLARTVAAVVTGPIHKEAFRAAGITHPGHTELLAELTGCQRYCMMLTSEQISCSLVTTHIGIADIPDYLNQSRVLETIQLTHEAMQALLRRPPQITVCGLNPHAGEHGLFGRGEEERLIQPAILAAEKQGIQLTGPISPDTAFVAEQRAKTDAYVCMYHDQGLIPLKALAFDSAINVTLGLPICRSSVDHGTALDIAWQGKVRTSSMLAAIQWAAQAGTQETVVSD